jgi:hypothetical protein
MILGCALVCVLDLILCTSLNSKVEKYFESAPMLWSEAYILHA